MRNESVVIIGSKRTPIGNFLGYYKNTSAVELGAAAIKAALEDSRLSAAAINAVIMGCVLPAGLGQAPARQAAHYAGIPQQIGCITVNKVCGSGMQALIFGHDGILANSYQAVAVGAMESMTNAPYLLPRLRQGYRFGHQQILDHLFFDGLEDAYEHHSMGQYAEATAKKYGFSREAQDEYALRSLSLARQAQQQGIFAREITPITINQGKEILKISEDEGPLTAKPEKIPQLKPAFTKDGSVTAANSSSIADGAASLIISGETYARKHQLIPRAKIIAHSTHAQEPAWFTTAPIHAIEQVLKKANWSVADVDLFEINEAFAVVVMAAIKELPLPLEKVNAHGGACVLGHPLATSGARIIVTLLNALEYHRLKRGVAALCIGGGEATAVAIERM